MNNHSKFISISIALAIIALFAALPLQAQTNNNVTINNLTYDGQSQNRQYMYLSWDTVANTQSVKLQVRGGGISDAWGTFNGFTTSTSGNETIMQLDNLAHFRVLDRKFWFRVKVVLTTSASTPWASVQES